MAGYSIERSRRHLEELGKKNEIHESEIKNLEKTKAELLEVRTDIENAEIPEESKEWVRKAISEKLEQVSEQAEKVSDQIGDNLKEIEKEIEETDEANENTKNQIDSMEDKQRSLDRINMGGIFNNSIEGLIKDIGQIDEISDALKEKRKNAEDLVRRARSL